MADKSTSEKTKIDTDKNEPELGNDMPGKHKKRKKKKERNDDLTESSKEMQQTLKDECNTLGIDQSVLDISENLPTRACQDAEESTKRKKKKKKEKKGKHESAEESEKLTTRIAGKITSDSNDDRICKHVPTISCEVPKESDIQKENCELSFENMEQNTGSDKTEKINMDEAETRKETSSSSCKVTEESGHHKKKKKEKKRKHESKLSLENVEQKIDEKMEKVDVSKNENGIGKDMPTSSCEVAEGSDYRKEEKGKHETVASLENVEQETGSVKVEIDVGKNEVETSKDMPMKISEVTEKSDNHTKKEKKRKHERDISFENVEQKTDGEKVEKIDLDKDENATRKDIPTSSCKVTEESNRHKKKKKEKKRKHEGNVSMENIEQNTDSVNIEINVGKKEAGTSKDMPMKSSEVIQESDNHTKHERDISFEKVEQKTDGEKMEKIDLDKNGTRNDMPTSSCEATEELVCHKKGKKEKKKKHERDISVEKVEQKTDSVKVQIDVGGNEADTSKGIPTKSSEVTEESASNKKKSRKVSFKNVEQKTDCEEMGKVDVDENGKREEMPTSSCEFTEKSDYHKKKEKKKKGKHESEVLIENVEQKTDSVNIEIDIKENEDETSKDIPTKCNELAEESDNSSKKKKDKKRKYGSDSSMENMEHNIDKKIDSEKMKEVGVNENIGESICSKRKKKPDHKGDLSVENVEHKTDKNVDNNKAGANEDIPISGCKVAEDSGHKKTKKERKRTQDIDWCENVEQKIYSKVMGVNVGENEAGMSGDMPTTSSEVTGESSHHAKKKKEKKRKREKKERKQEGVLSFEKIKDSSNVGAEGVIEDNTDDFQMKKDILNRGFEEVGSTAEAKNSSGLPVDSCEGLDNVKRDAESSSKRKTNRTGGVYGVLEKKRKIESKVEGIFSITSVSVCYVLA